jgi:hypothetical protein
MAVELSNCSATYSGKGKHNRSLKVGVQESDLMAHTYKHIHIRDVQFFIHDTNILQLFTGPPGKYLIEHSMSQ